jgi:mono/diheme cytochrome c family protein
MRKSVICAIGAVCAVAWLPAYAQETQLSEDAKAGQEIAERICSRCHAIGPEGASPHKDAPPFRTIAAKGNVQNLEEALGEGIVVGHPDMPQFQFRPRDVGALVAYLRSLSGKS